MAGRGKGPRNYLSSDPIGLADYYNQYMDIKYEENSEERYVGKESYYHASGAGFCSRKLYYESVLKAEKTNEVKDESKRRMRLGTIVHEDFQNSLSELYIQNNIYINNIYKDKEKKYIKKKKVKFHIEQEIIIEEVNVRGFYDIVAVEDESGRVYLYDLKTVGGYQWKQKFGFTPSDESYNYKLQLGTYGYAIKKQFGRLDGMFLFFYNKDTSALNNVPVPESFVNLAYNYWVNINKEHEKGLPDFMLGISPAEKWACNYCAFKDMCNPPDFSNHIKRVR